MKLLQKRPRSLPNIDFKIRGKMGGIKYPCFAEIKYDGFSVTVICKYVDTGATHTTMGIKGRVLKKEVWIVTEAFERQVEHAMLERLPVGIYLAEWIHGSGDWESRLKISDTVTVMERTYLVFFDVIECEGVDMTCKAYIDRREILSHLKLGPTAFICNTEYELLERFEFITMKGINYEGLVVKNMDETFLGQKWMKMKPPERTPNHGTTTGSI